MAASAVHPVLTYIKSQYNKQETSDFTLTDSAGKKLHLHKFILRSNDYFKQFLDSTVTADKSTMSVQSVEVVSKLVWYMYTGEFSIPANLGPADFIDLCDVTEMWLLLKTLKVKLFEYLYNNWKVIVASDIRYAEILFKYFGDHPCIEVIYQLPGDSKANYKTQWSGIILRTHLAEWLETKKDEITRDMIEGQLFKNHLKTSVKVEVLVRLGAYDKITIHVSYLTSLHSALGSHYDPKSKVFTAKQLSAIKTCKFIGTGGITQTNTGKTTIIKSLVPFSGQMYHHLGSVHGHSTRYHAVFVTINQDFDPVALPSGGFRKKLFINGHVYDIVSIYMNTEKVSECFAGNDYSFGLRCSNDSEWKTQKLPAKTSNVYWVDDL